MFLEMPKEDIASRKKGRHDRDLKPRCIGAPHTPSINDVSGRLDTGGAFIRLLHVYWLSGSGGEHSPPGVAQNGSCEIRRRRETQGGVLY